MTTTNFDGRTAIITGGSRGIGLAIAQRLALGGANIVLTSRKQESADAAAEQVGGNTIGVAAHAVDEDAARHCVDVTLERFGSIDILVNNAGTNPAYGPLIDQDHARFTKTFDVNLWAPLLWTSLAAKAWMREHGGAMVNTASIGGMHQSPNMGMYNATKAALIHVTKQLALELSPRVRVNAIAPGVVRTKLAEALWKEHEELVAEGTALGASASRPMWRLLWPSWSPTSRAGSPARPWCSTAADCSAIRQASGERRRPAVAGAGAARRTRPGAHRPARIPRGAVRRRTGLGALPGRLRRAGPVAQLSGAGRGRADRGGCATGWWRCPQRHRDGHGRTDHRGVRQRGAAARVSAAVVHWRTHLLPVVQRTGCGSDLAGVATRAVRDGDDWIVNGQKVWTSSAQNAQRAILVARTDPTVPKHQGLTYFVLDMTDPGVDVRPLRQITGEAEFNEVFLTDVRVPDAYRLGAVGGGWKVATTTLNNERVAIGSMAGGTRESGIIGKVTEAWRTNPPYVTPRCMTS